MDVPNVSVPAPTRSGRFLEGLGAAWLVVAVVGVVRTEWRVATDSVVVTLLARLHDEEWVRMARATRDPRDDVAEIYGTPVGTPIELVVPGGRNSGLLLTPAEAPDRRLMPADTLVRFGIRTPTGVRLIGALFTIGIAGAGLTAYLVGRARRRRGAAPIPPPPP